MNHRLNTASLLLRLALAATFLSAVASRINLWGHESSGWKDFLEYVAEVNSFAPARLIPFLAVTATALEITFSILLIIGYKIRWAATGAAVLTLLFALAMAISFGIKSPLDYSVFVDCTGAFLLSSVKEYKWSLDEYLVTRKTNKS